MGGSWMMQAGSGRAMWAPAWLVLGTGGNGPGQAPLQGGGTWPQHPCCGCGVSRRYWPPWEELSGQEELFLGAPWDLATCGYRFPRCKSNPKGVAILFTTRELPHLEQEEHF